MVGLRPLPLVSTPQNELEPWPLHTVYPGLHSPGASPLSWPPGTGSILPRGGWAFCTPDAAPRGSKCPALSFSLQTS